MELRLERCNIRNLWLVYRNSHRVHQFTKTDMGVKTVNKTLKILLIIFSAQLTFFLVCCFLIHLSFLDADGFFENYSDWHEVEIPTESNLKPTVKLPNEWNFVIENDRLKIKDKEGNVIATEVYEGWRINHFLGSTKYDNKDQMDINPELPEYYQDLGSYELFTSIEKPCWIYKIESDGVTQYAINVNILSMYSVQGDYELFLLFDEQFTDIAFFKKILKSYFWVGYIRYDEDDYIYEKSQIALKDFYDETN